MRTLVTVVGIIVVVLLGAWALGWLDQGAVEQDVVETGAVIEETGETIEATGEVIEAETEEAIDEAADTEIDVDVEEVEELPEPETTQ